VISTEHQQEWLNSGVDPEIIHLNVRSLQGADAYEYLIYTQNISRRNDGRLRDADLHRYRHIEKGGWWCSGIDLLQNYQPMQWGCFKADSPRRDSQKVHKIIKYEHPPHEPTQAFFLQVSPEIWGKVSKRCGIPIKKVDARHPHGFWYWVYRRNVPVIIVEGAKKAGVLLTNGYAAIALPGVNSGYRNPKVDSRAIGKPFLIPELLHFATNRQINICFDRDTKIETVERVRNAIAKTARLLTSLGSRVNIIELPSQKGVDDFIVAMGSDAFDTIYNAAISLELWQVQLHKLLTYPQAVTINQRFLDGIVIPDNQKLIVIKSPKGTGKTEFLVREVAIAHQRGQRVLVLSHRIQLGEALCDRFGIDYVTEMRTSQTGGVLGYGLCIDSMHLDSLARFNPDDWTNAVLIIDECDQVFWHLLDSRTEIRKCRLTILANLQRLFQNILSHPQGKIYLVSADVTDIDINYIKSLTGFAIAPYIIRNEYKNQSGTALVYPGRDPSHLLAALKENIRQGGVPIICCSAQKAKSRWSTQSIERILKSEFPDKKILRIDSQTLGDPTDIAYGSIKYLNEILPLYDIVIVSPSVETGLSIDIKNHFTGVWAIAQGVQPENSVRQMIARLRQPVTRHLWVANYGITGCRVGNGSTSYQSLLLSQKIASQAHIALLASADHQGDFDFGEINQNFQPESLKTWAIRACVINAGMKRYKQTILEGLVDDGYQLAFVTEIVGDVEATLQDAIAVCNNLYKNECQEISASLILTEAELSLLNKKKAKTKIERYQERKANLLNSYKVEVTSELVEKDDMGWYNQLRLHYYLTIGRPFLEVNEVKKAKSYFNANGDLVWQPDFNRGQFLAKVLLLEELEIAKFMEPGKQMKGIDADMQTFASLAKKHKYIINNYLAVRVTDKEFPIPITQKLLAKIGCKLDRIGEVRVQGKSQRIYEFTPPDDGRDVVMSRWQEMDNSCVDASTIDI